MGQQLSPQDIARVKAFLDQISPVQSRQLTVLESGRGGPGINIPLAWDTNPANFPRYEFREYPKMLLKKATQADVDAWKAKHRMVDTRTGEASWPCAAPNVGDMIPVSATNNHVASGFANQAGDPLIMQSKEQEDEFFGCYPEAKTIDVSLSALGVGNLVNKAGEIAAQESELDRINRENVELEALAAAKKRNAELRAQLGEAEGAPTGEKPRRQYTRRAKPPAEDAPLAGESPPADAPPAAESPSSDPQPQFEMPKNLG